MGVVALAFRREEGSLCGDAKKQMFGRKSLGYSKTVGNRGEI